MLRSAVPSAVSIRTLVNNPSSKSGEAFRVVEVGARDGLQNEKKMVPTAIKVELINKLSEVGLKTVEATSYVSPKWVPQMGDHDNVITQIKKYPGVAYPVLVPNLAGLKNALQNENVKEIAVFGAASEGFSKKNINCSIEEGFNRIKEVTEEALKNNLRVRGYISTVIACPYDGKTKPSVVADLTEKLLSFGCYEVSLGDTIGAGGAGSVGRLLDEVSKAAPLEKLAVHFHDTYGQALSNVLVAINRGIRVADSSIAGLGGCPYAVGATGNLATEDLVYMLHDLGFNTGINLPKLIQTSEWICAQMGRNNASRASIALLSKKKKL
uniref:hydroxymethylglutaryl-CoA lyase n=1 Tax=Panagrellus redivivus TaxID=6233 RepID=A0A7E4VJV9_PANRE